ncbi:MAG: hypothetical protein ACK476_14610 [Fluviicola sp.]|jgi:hypothetical protein
MKTFSQLIFLIILVTSCQKKFKANYTLNKYEYAAGDMIEYSNLTLKAKEYKWEIIDSEGKVDTTFLGTNPVIVSRILSNNLSSIINSYQIAYKCSDLRRKDDGLAGQFECF